MGLNCIKGYFNAKIIYGADRLTEPLMRVNAKGEFDKKGKFKPVTWQKAFDEMAKQFKKHYSTLGPAGCSDIRLRAVYDHGGICCGKAHEGRLQEQ